MSRKIFKSGNSLVVSLPQESMELLGLGEGSEVTVTLDQDGRRILIEPSAQPGIEISPEFARQLDDFIKQYRPALEALAK